MLSFSGSLARKCVSLNNQPCMSRPTLIDFDSNENNQGPYPYPFMVSLDRYDRICNTIDDASARMCVLNKTEDVNLNESKAFIKHVSNNFRCKFDSIKYNDPKSIAHAKRIAFKILVHVLVRLMNI